MSVPGFQAACRAAAVELLADYAASEGVKLQVYPGRPTSLFTPTAFVDRLSEALDYSGPTFHERIVQVDVVVVHGLFDSKEAANQKDAFADGFIDYVTGEYHAAGANTLIAVRSVDDEPGWTPDWTPANYANGPQPVFYATRLTLEGRAQG